MPVRSGPMLLRNRSATQGGYSTLVMPVPDLGNSLTFALCADANYCTFDQLSTRICQGFWWEDTRWAIQALSLSWDS